MESYCLKCKKYTKTTNSQVSSTSNGKLMIISKCAISNSKKSKFIKKQDAKGILSNLGIKTPLSKIPVSGDFFFFNAIPLKLYKMNEIVNKFLLAGDKFMSEIHLRQPQIVYSAFGPFTKNKARIQKFKETGDTSYI